MHRKNGLDKLFANGQVATQYVNEAGVPTMDEEWNVNGSYCSIEGITSPDGRVLGKMAHSGRPPRNSSDQYLRRTGSETVRVRSGLL